MKKINVTIIALTVLGLVLAALSLRSYIDAQLALKTPQTCLEASQQLNIVSDIATRTGQLPNGTVLPTGSVVNVKQDLCKKVFDYPGEVQIEARELQGNTNDIQNAVNPQR